jgi:sulfate adenylyltransferase subunit 1
MTKINKTNNEKQLLRFTTAGSVDDGKSTLIGRLLHDTGAILADQYESLKKASNKNGNNELNLALLTDGLKDERQQGITIDVAYRYFATEKRKFIIADTPGHIQYTRNMVTGASTANLALVLTDARKGIIEQTKRHAFIASLLNIPHLILCINKMDLVDYSEKVFNKIKDDFSKFSAKLNIKDIQFIPISALYGDNIIDKSLNMKWYKGPDLLYILENIHINSDYNLIDCRFPIQLVITQKTKSANKRYYAGKIESGIFKPGDNIMHLPSKLTTQISTISSSGVNINEAYPPMSVNMEITDDIDISRGDMFVREHNQPTVSKKIELIICWFNQNPIDINKKYIIRHTTCTAMASIQEIRYKIDINTLHRLDNDKTIGMNDFARISIVTSQALNFDKYIHNRATGSIIFIDPTTNETVGAGMIK